MPQRPPRRTQRGAISAVAPGSIAHDAGLLPGDRVLAVNGHTLRDPIDFRFHTADDIVELQVVHDGEPAFLDIEKPPDEPLGIEFDDDAFDGTRICNNKCFFCFLKGLPKGLRKPLYIKDDDYRLSFLHGNFVTLTNLTDDDWRRLREQRLSPLNISVHATDLNLRRELLGNPRAPDIQPQLRQLHDWGIDAHTQVVLCPGVNDRQHLDRTVADLLNHPNVRSIGVVPVGSSLDADDRINHPGMRTHTAHEARTVVRQLNRWQRLAREQRGASIVFPSDEFYLRAGARIPAANRYDGFPQWENGIGMTRTLLDDWRNLRRRIRRGRLQLPRDAHATLACGTLIAPTLARIAEQASQLTGLRLSVVPVDNTLFGQRVNVAGLIPGHDFADTLANIPLAQHVFLPRASLDYFGQRFLDDTTPQQLSQQLQRPISFAYNLSDVLQSIAAPDDAAANPSPARSNGRAWTSPPPVGDGGGPN